MQGNERDQVAAFVDNVSSSFSLFISYEVGRDDANANNTKDKEQDAYSLDFHELSALFMKLLIRNDSGPDSRRWLQTRLTGDSRAH
jgi:hypothetical protein